VGNFRLWQLAQRMIQGEFSDSEGYVMQNIPAVGVMVGQVQRQLNVIFYDQPSWFPSSLESNLWSAIIRMSMSLNRYPPAGTSFIGNMEREIIGTEKGLEWRLDLENLNGTNLRK
jgi:hypothetical protein